MAAEDRLTILGKYIPLVPMNDINSVFSFSENQPCVVLFSVVRSINSTSCRIAKIDTLRELFNAPSAARQNFAVLAGNGDGNATSVHAEGVTYQDNAYWLTLSTRVNGQFRASGVIIYAPYIIDNTILI